MPVSKYFRIGVEGTTTDKRNITRDVLQKVAANYNRTKFCARVWMEHFRSILPDSPFRAYGDVVELKAEEADIDGEKKMALYARVDATSDLVDMQQKKRQKIFHSMEIDPNFAGSGEPYLVGLGVTDDPASLGTEMMAFSAGAESSPLTHRKQNPENMFSAAIAADMEFEDATPPAGESLFAKVKELLGIKGKSDDARFSDMGQAIETIAESQKGLIDSLAATQAALATLTADVKKQSDDFAALKKQLETSDDGSQQRPPAAGSDADSPAVKTDC